jgi:hypothetical protein
MTLSNAVPVPYHGRSQGYGPIFKMVTNQYPFFGPNSDFEFLVGALVMGGCTYDDLELGKPICSVMGWTNYLAALAAGIWFSPIPVHYHASGDDVSINTDARPASIENAKTGTSTNYAATFYREGRAGTDQGKLKYIYDNGDVSGVTETPHLITSSGNPVSTGSGVIAIKSPNALGANLALFYKSPTSTSLQYLTGTLGASSMTFGSVQTLTSVQTDRIPAVVNFAGGVTGPDLWYVWKDVASSVFYAMPHNSPSPMAIVTSGGTTVSSQSAPAVVVAANRLWVIYRHPSNNHLAFTSSSDGRSWSDPQILENAWTLWDPEANYYQPLGGAVGDGRIWIFYKRPYDASQPDSDEGTRMISFKPQSDGSKTLLSNAVYLYQTRVHPGYEPYYSAFRWGVILRLYHPRDESSQIVNGVRPLWRIEKIGEG